MGAILGTNAKSFDYFEKPEIIQLFYFEKSEIKIMENPLVGPLERALQKTLVKVPWKSPCILKNQKWKPFALVIGIWHCGGNSRYYCKKFWIILKNQKS